VREFESFPSEEMQKNDEERVDEYVEDSDEAKE
jgi:hypothetical protein